MPSGSLYSSACSDLAWIAVGLAAIALLVLVLGWVSYRGMIHYRIRDEAWLRRRASRSGDFDESVFDLPWIEEDLASPTGYRFGSTPLHGRDGRARGRVALFHHGIGSGWMAMIRYMSSSGPRAGRSWPSTPAATGEAGRRPAELRLLREGRPEGGGRLGLRPLRSRGATALRRLRRVDGRGHGAAVRAPRSQARRGDRGLPLLERDRRARSPPQGRLGAASPSALSPSSSPTPFAAASRASACARPTPPRDPRDRGPDPLHSRPGGPLRALADVGGDGRDEAEAPAEGGDRAPARAGSEARVLDQGRSRSLRRGPHVLPRRSPRPRRGRRLWRRLRPRLGRR